jgi:hypothetical protein
MVRQDPAAWRSPWTAWWALGLIAAGVWVALRAWTPLGDPVCALRQIAHIGCATCGLTRAFTALARGDLGASLAFHPMALVLAGEVAAAWAVWGLALARGAPAPEARGIPRVVAVNALAFLLVWVARLVTGTIQV